MSVAAHVQRVLVQRLQRSYWPAWCSELAKLSQVRRIPPIDAYEPTHRDLRYDLGRIHYFYNQLRRRQPIDPIVIDTYWFNMRPCGVVIDDGHHRFIAAVLARRRRIPASISGLVKYAEYLTGARRTCPLDA